MRAIEHVVAVLSRLVGVARHDLKPELGREFQIAMMDGANDLATHLQHASVVELHALDTTTDARTRLDNDDVRSRARQVAGARESTEASTDNDYIRLHDNLIREKGGATGTARACPVEERG